MTITPFEPNLYQFLEPFFSGHAFALLAEKKQFRRLTDTGFQNIILSSISQSNDVALDVKFGCRNNQIEHIAQQFLKTPVTSWPDTNTVLISIDQFRGFSNFRIHSENELASACETIEFFFNTQGFNFLTIAGGLPILDWLLNEHPHQPCLYVYNQTHRFYKGLIAARLNHSPDFDNLIDSYRNQLNRHTQNPYEPLNFERLITFLQHYSAN